MQNPFFRLKALLLSSVFSMLLFSVQVFSQMPIDAQFGVSLCGPEFGQEKMPGVVDVDYVYPTAEEINYFANKGVVLVQLPFRWERVQKKLGERLDAEEITRMKAVINHCDFRGIKVILNMHNFGCYKLGGKELILGTPQLPINYLKDFWKRMAANFKECKNIYAYDIMNEPHDLGPNVWLNAAQQTIFGIREIDGNKTIMIEGDHFANANVWDVFSDNLKRLYDPASNIVFNAHCYFDYDVSGKYQRSYNFEMAHDNTGIEKVKPFVNWLKQNNLKGFIGEFGVPKTDHRWLKTLENFLEYLADNNISGSYWAAGPWWKNYPLSLEPVNGKDQPQMHVLAKFIGDNAVARNAQKRSKNSPTVPVTEVVSVGE